MTAVVAVVAGATLPAALFAGVGSAAAQDSATGNVEICKVLTAPVINMNATPTFTYAIAEADGSTTSVSVPAGTNGVPVCSAPIPVAAGATTITEIAGPWYAVTGITEMPGQSYLTDSDTSSGTADVMVSAGDTGDAVTFTNDPQYGWLEVCKQAAPTSTLTGDFTFNLVGEDGYTGSTTVPVGGCSNPAVEVPAGQVQVTEAGTNLYVTGITATLNASSTSEIVPEGSLEPAYPDTTNPDLTTGQVVVTVGASPDTSMQTDVTYTNDTVGLKVCKYWDSAAGPESDASMMFPFTFAASGPVGPSGAPAAVSLQAGTCSNYAELRPGTQITVTEGVVPGTKADNITASGSASVVPGSVSLGDRTISVLVGAASGTPGGDEAQVNFWDENAGPGTLKICADAGTPTPNATSYTYSVSGTTVLTTVAVGSCAVVGGSQTPVWFPFNSTQTITQLASTGDQTSAITVVPTDITEVIGGVATVLTDQPVEVGSPTLGGSGGASSVSVMIGEGTLTEVHFVSNAASAGSTTTGSTTTGSTTTGSTTTGSTTTGSTTTGSTTTGSTGTSDVVLNAAPAASTVSAVSTASNTSSNASSANSTSDLNSAALAKAKSSLVSVNKAIAITRKTIARYKAALVHSSSSHRVALSKALKRLEKRLASLVTKQHGLLATIRSFS